MISRTLGPLLRGSAKPVQLLLACVVGALIGFVPGAKDHPGLLALHILLLVLLNANLGVALLVAGVSKLACLALMPLSFSLGRTLVDGGATRPFFAWAVEAPVLALLDLDVYAVTGGLVLGLVIGVVAGVVLVTIVGGFRRKFAGLEEGSDKYKALLGKGWVRFLMWLLLGKRKGKKSYGELLEGGFGNPIRVVGVVLAALFFAFMWFSPSLLGGSMLASATRSGLEGVHGATVDVGSVTLDLAEGRLAIDGLAMADPENLDTDLFRAARLEADGSMADLLRGRLALDKLVISEAVQGGARSSPGQLVGEAREPSARPADEPDSGGMSSGSLATYLEDSEALEQRLRQAKEWMESLSADDDDEGGAGGVEGAAGLTLEERLRLEVERLGYGRVRAPGLRSSAPALLIRDLEAHGVATPVLGDELLDIDGAYLSSDPALVPQPARITLRSRAETVFIDLGMGGPDAAPEDNVVRAALHGISGDTAGAMLGGKLSGGTIDMDLDGAWAGGRVGQLDMPLDVTLRDVVVDIAGGPRQVSELVLPFALSGALDNPRIRFEGDALQDALKAQAMAVVDEKKAELEAKVDEKQAELEAKADEEVEEVKQKAAKKLGDKLGGLFGGDDDDG